MMKIIACSAVAIMVSASLAHAQTYKTPSQGSAVDQLHATPSILDDDGNINNDPAMTPSTTTTGTHSKASMKGKAECQTGRASSNNPDNTDNPAMTAACQP